MPLALIIIAMGLIAAGVRGSYKQLGTLLKGDFTGQDNFLVWTVAIGLVGCIGYVPALKNFSRLFILLVMLALFLKVDAGLFSKFVTAIQGAQAGAANPSPGTPATGSSDSGGGSVGGLVNSATSLNPASNPIQSGLSAVGSSLSSFFGGFF